MTCWRAWRPSGGSTRHEPELRVPLVGCGWMEVKMAKTLLDLIEGLLAEASAALRTKTKTETVPPSGRVLA